jgi:hypothetical protein
MEIKLKLMRLRVIFEVRRGLRVLGTLAAISAT